MERRQDELMRFDPLVRSCVRKFAPREPIHLSDEYADGWFGLLLAAKRCDATEPFFVPMAIKCIRGSVLRGLNFRRNRTRAAEKVFSTISFSQMGNDDGDGRDFGS